MSVRAVGRAVGGCLRVSRTLLPLTSPTIPSTTLTGCGGVRCYAMRLELTEHGIVWRRPPYVPSWCPEKSGDLQPRQPADLTRPKLKLIPAAAHLDQVDEVTRELLSLRFGSRREQRDVEEYDLVRRVQRHAYDDLSIEVRIAKLTLKIRNLQEATMRCKKNTLERIRLQECIDKRKKMLKKLRTSDYKRFEWLLEELDIIYRPHPPKYQRITRKDSLRRLVELHGKEVREQRMAEYRDALEAQKEPFLKEKAETVKWIAETEESLGLPVSVTVPDQHTTQEDSNELPGAKHNSP